MRRNSQSNYSTIYQNRREPFEKGQQEPAVAKTMSNSHFAASMLVWAGICVTETTSLIFITETSKSTLATKTSQFQEAYWSPGVPNTLAPTDLCFNRTALLCIWPDQRLPSVKSNFHNFR
ncbi:hypothetical protein KIN20_005223, partial [Parelaphostrongylus tenuis]